MKIKIHYQAHSIRDHITTCFRQLGHGREPFKIHQKREVKTGTKELKPYRYCCRNYFWCHDTFL